MRRGCEAALRGAGGVTVSLLTKQRRARGTARGEHGTGSAFTPRRIHKAAAPSQCCSGTCRCGRRG
eukprot:5778438-Prymnesium_polylepis.2